MKIQIDSTVRTATSEEQAVIEAIHAEAQAQENAHQAIVAAKESAKGKLAALGLTEAEIAALLGV